MQPLRKGGNPPGGGPGRGFWHPDRLGRRNLNPDTASLLRGRIYNRTKKAHGGFRESSDQNDHLKTSQKLATQFGVGQATIKRDGQFARAVEVVKQADPTIEQRVHSGKVAKQSVTAVAAEPKPFFAEDAKRRQKLSIKARDEKGRAAPVKEKIPEVVPQPQARNEAAKSVGVNARYVQDPRLQAKLSPQACQQLCRISCDLQLWRRKCGFKNALVIANINDRPVFDEPIFSHHQPLQFSNIRIQGQYQSR